MHMILIIAIYCLSITKTAATTVVSVKAHKFYRSLMFIWSYIFLVQHIMVNKIKIINSREPEFSYPEFFKQQPWTKLFETKVENPVNSRNSSIFQIPDSLPYPSISMLNQAQFCCQKPKTMWTTLIWGEMGFSLKIDFLFCLNSFVQDCSMIGFSTTICPNYLHGTYIYLWKTVNKTVYQKVSW